MTVLLLATVKDFIYAMPFDAETVQGMTFARFRTWRRGQNKNGFYSIEMSNSVGGNMTLTPEFVELFCLPGDRRNDVIAGNTGENINLPSFDVYQYDNTGIPELSASFGGVCWGTDDYPDCQPGICEK